MSVGNDQVETYPSASAEIAAEITVLVTGHATPDLAGLHQMIKEPFKTRSEDEQSAIIRCLGISACRFQTNNTDEDFLCPVCDEPNAELQLFHDEVVFTNIDELFDTLLALKPLLQRRQNLRVLALQALRKIVSHTRTSEKIRLKGLAGEWCRQALRSPERELKIVASCTLSAFVRDDKQRDTELLHENCVGALEFLHALGKDNSPATQEIVVLSLVDMARVVGDEEMNIILLRLVDYLGHQNAYIAALAFSELQQLAQHLQLSVPFLFRPFWRTLSVIIVQNITKRPVIAQQVSDLMGMQVDGLLQLIEEHALPYLVLSKDINTINRICNSSASHMSPFDLCYKVNNFPRILALLITQSFSDPEDTIMNLLLNVSEGFNAEDLAGWVHVYPAHIACELLKSIADDGRGKSAKQYQGLHLLATLLSRRSGSALSSSRRTELAATFLEQNALAVVTHFTVKLNDISVREPVIEKRRYLAALGEIVKITKSRISVALPQFCACLRSSMDNSGLCNAAFETWSEMMMNVNEDEIRNLISQTFALVIKHWTTLNSTMQHRAYEVVSKLFQSHQALIRDCHGTLPSLRSIPLMSKFENDLEKLRKQRDERNQIIAFVSRLQDENMVVVEQALHELADILSAKQEFLQKSILREQPDEFVADLTRAILDACVKFESSSALQLHAGQCLGAIGCLDPSKIESTRERKRFVVLSNFSQAEETIGFLMFFMEQILVKEYVSTSNLREKGFLAWSLQRLLLICDLPSDINSRARVGDLGGKDRQWFELSDTTRLVLTPFLTSRFVSAGKRVTTDIKYPLFKPGMNSKMWLTELTLDLLNRGSNNERMAKNTDAKNIDLIFDISARLVFQGQGTSIAAFLLPYAVVNLLLTGIEKDKEDIVCEISWILQQKLSDHDVETQDSIRQCSQSVFDCLDYLSLWLQDSRKQSALLSAKARVDRGVRDPALDRLLAQMQIIESVVGMIPPQIITQKALECKSYARALFHQEQYVMTQKEPCDADYRRLQDIYAQIDEPDGIEGFSAQMKFLDIESEVMEHKKAGRWQAAQSWYEMQLTERPSNIDIQINLMQCLKESGQHDVLLHHFDGIASRSDHPSPSLLPFAVEAAWVTGRWDKLSNYLHGAPRSNFAVGLGHAMLALRQDEEQTANEILKQMLQTSTSEFTTNSTSSLQACHEPLLKLHILDDLRIMIGTGLRTDAAVLGILKKRLDILGSNVADKQYVLGIQRAIMQSRMNSFNKQDIAASWMTSARLARKAQAFQQAFNAILHGSASGDKSATIEQAKLMWQEGDHRKAIQTLEGAIEAGTFGAHVRQADAESMTIDLAGQGEQNDTIAKAFVLLGKWLDQAGQTQSEIIIKTFRKSTEQNRRWEKGWYNLGRHYNKILESEKLKPPGKESQPFLTGEAAKLVIDNFLRALVSGSKYMFQTLPKVLTLWLDLVGSEIEHDARRGNTQFHQHNKIQRKKVIDETNATVKKYLERIQPYALYTILPQLVARICHTDQAVNNLLQMMIVKVVKAFPQQALWTVLATVKSGSKDRATRGLGLLRKAVENTKKDSKVYTASEMRDFITASQKFSDEVLRIADFPIEQRISRVSLSREFGFNHKIAPSKLVVPSEAGLIPNIPSNNDLQNNKSFRAFAKEPVTITAFLDEARVLPSLQKPRKLSLRGSDGKIYSVLAKPHDDLRKDQRLMEFNTMINRSLKHDIDAAKRRLYIRTYAVIPLNEECGLIEWVDGLATMRDILLKLYDQRGIKPDYAAVRDALDKICTKSEDKAKDFVDMVQSRFPPILRMWFIENFPDPTTWFNARLRYTRTCAVMSMVGHVLGLGDRHGENILLEEGSGGILHVDFNCLFDKGLTFEKPECVPFRLTHNLQNAMGSYKYNGPFRRCCEITINLLRNNEDALMTILETFLHDPTTDFQTAGKKRKPAAGYGAGVEVPDTPERMLEGVKAKVRGMLPGESVPLSVGGYVDYMIRQATNEANLARMYIGWCAFF
ncbi:hypothetical protein R6Q59_009857 [Mikania micrantha]